MSLGDIENYLKGTHHTQKKRSFGFSDTESTAKKAELHQPGDVWEETNPVTGVVTVWEQKLGYRVKRPKNSFLGEVNEVKTSFWNCPKDSCTCTAPKRLDEKFRMIRGMCADCAIAAETMMKIDGKYEQYEKDRMRENAADWLKDAENDVKQLKEMLTKTEFVNEDGSVEKWIGPDRTEMLASIDAEFELFKQELLSKIQ